MSGIELVQLDKPRHDIFNASDRIIVALDGMNQDEALNFTASIPQLRWVKVGYELFTVAGPEIIDKLRDQGLRIFLDLKFHDIPVTMAGACRNAARLGAELITVHAAAGSDALKCAQIAAIEGAASVNLSRPTLLAVTVLTSWNAQNFENELAINEPILNYVQRLARLAAMSDIGGCVCSPLEVSKLRSIYHLPFALVTPGIRLEKATVYDQKRIMTPVMAIEAGSTQVVIGRPITVSVDPADTFLLYCKSLSSIRYK